MLALCCLSDFIADVVDEDEELSSLEGPSTLLVLLLAVGCALPSCLFFRSHGSSLLLRNVSQITFGETRSRGVEIDGGACFEGFRTTKIHIGWE